MGKFTRHIKKNKKNMTHKNGISSIKRGGNNDDINTINDERQGIVDIVKEKISDAASNVVNKAEDIGLNALGLERINQTKNKIETNNETTEKLNENLEKIGDAASRIVSTVGNAVDKTSAAIVNNVNDVLGSKIVSENVKEAGKETGAIIGKLTETFNNAMNDPVVKAEVKEAIENVSEIAPVVVKAAEEPLKEAAKVTVEAGTEALGAASSGAVKVATDILASIPGIGAIFDIGKIINDSSKAASAMVEAGTDIAETASDAYIKTTENIKEGIKQLEEKKKLAEQISQRTTNSINQFENPLQSKLGGSKTKRRFLKRKLKSKRVRFAI